MVRYFLSLLMISLGLSLDNKIADAQDQNSLGYSLAICYLQNIKKQLKRTHSSYIKDNTIAQIIFGQKNESVDTSKTTRSGTQASFYGATLSVNREKSYGKEEIILTARVVGAPEEFEGKNILESEKALLKYRIIAAYLAYKEKINKHFFGWLRSSGMLDSTTRVTSSPSNYSENVFPYMRYVYTDKYEMTISCIFTVSEFDALIEKYCNIDDIDTL